MPNIKSAKKRMRSDAKKHATNQAVISELKTMGKKLLTFIQDPPKAKAYAQELISRYDRAVSKGIIPRGRADRKKSRITQLIARPKK